MRNRQQQPRHGYEKFQMLQQGSPQAWGAEKETGDAVERGACAPSAGRRVDHDGQGVAPAGADAAAPRHPLEASRPAPAQRSASAE